MLPVPHQACTLATGALRSVCTMIVRPLGKIHLCAVTGGNVIGAEPPEEAALGGSEVNTASMRTARAHSYRS